MRSAAGSLEVAHARMWARWGGRASDATWQRIEVARELGTVLELARASALAPWIAGIGADAGAHAIEHALRRHWREGVAELQRWMPPEWHEALAWCALLPELPLLHHLACGAPAPDWVADDELLRSLVPPAAREPEADRPAQRDDPLRELLAAGRAEPESLPALWQQGWRRRCPAGPAAAQVERLLGPLLATHAQAFAAPAAVDGWALRRALQARLLALWRRTLVEPLAAFVWLALRALEAERLRAELVTRAAFPMRGSLR